MPTVQFVDGPGGSSVPFSGLPVNGKFQFGGVPFSKKNDAEAFNLSNGDLVGVAPDQQVSIISVTWETTAHTVADDVQMGDVWTDINGAEWVRVEDGAINVASGYFQADGDFAPFRSHAKTTVVKPDV